MATIDPAETAALAVLAARTAVAEDTQGNIDAAIAAYLEACKLLKAMPTERGAELVAEKVASYQTRIKLLQSFELKSRRPGKQVLPSRGSSTLLGEGSAEEGMSNRFNEVLTMEVVPFPKPIPTESRRRPYALMRMYSQSLKVGSYITPSIFLPPEVWFQMGLKLPAMGQKYECCDAVVDQLVKMQGEDVANAETFAAELGYFVETLPDLQNTLAKNLSCVAEVDTNQQKYFGMRSIATSLSRAAAAATKRKVNDPTVYIGLLLQLFDNAQFIEQVYDEFAERKGEPFATEVCNMCDVISAFFLDAICPFVFEDCMLLANRYLQEQSAIFME